MKKFMKLFKKNERGMTLVELLAVLVILAIVGVIAFVAIGNVMENSRQDAHIANAQQLIASAKLYETSGETIDATNGVSSTTLEQNAFLDTLVSPWDDDGEYVGVVTKDEGDYIVSLDGKGCQIDANELAIKSLDREELCGKDQTKYNGGTGGNTTGGTNG